MDYMKKILLLIVISLLIFTINLSAQQQGFGCIRSMEFISGSGIEKNNSKMSPSTDKLPLFGRKAKEDDRRFALPFGVGFNTMYYNQKYQASNLLLTSDSSSITARADTMIQNTSAYEMKAYIRPNIWLFPFLNVYGVIGYTKGVISPNIQVPSIILENVPVFDSLVVDTLIEIRDEIGYVGPTYGFGATFSMGFKYVFFMVDYNYSITDPTDLDENLHNHFLSPKAGVFLGKSNNKAFGALWVGGMFISNDQSFNGKIDIADINPAFIPLLGEEAIYQGTISAKQRWNFVIGGSLIVNNRHHLVIEGGFLGRQQITIGYDFRF